MTIRTSRTSTLLLALCLFCLFCLFFTLWPRSVAANPPAPTRAEKARSFVKSLPVSQQTIDGLPIDFYEQFPALPATLTRIGNSHTGIAPEARAGFPDGAHIRTSFPTTLERVALEKHKNGDVLIRTLTGWAEGRWHTVWWSLEGKYIGGHFDFPWDQRHDGIESQRYGSGLLGYTAKGFVGDTPESREEAIVTITEIPKGDTTAVPGYYWTSGAASCELRTPKAHFFCRDSFDAALPDPSNPSRMFTTNTAYWMDWSKPGDGKEYKGHRSTIDLRRYPTDGRMDKSDQHHVEALRKIGGIVYQFSSRQSGTSLLVHRWDEEQRVMVPVLAMYTTPNKAENVRGLVGMPSYDAWGTGAVWRDANNDGRSSAEEWSTFSARNTDGFPLYYLWNEYRMQVSTTGEVYFLPYRGRGTAGNTRPVLRWKPLNPAKPFPSPENLDYLSLPDALTGGTADAVEHLKVDWGTGDLIAIVRRKSGDGFEWRLERYAGWLKATEAARKAKKPVYSVGNIATQVRREYGSMSPYNAAFDCSYELAIGAMKGAVGGLVAEGDFVFVAEAQGCGIRVYRASTGQIVGRCFSPATPNATLDTPQAFQAWQVANEYRVSVMDFHGSNVVWRIKKTNLTQ